MDENTIVMVTTDNGTEVFTWPDGGNTPFKGTKGMTTEGGFRSPAIIRWPGKVPRAWFRTASCRGWTGCRPSSRPRAIRQDRRRAEGRQGHRRHHLQGASRRLQPDGHADRQGSEPPPGGLLLRESTLGAVRIGDWKYTFIDQPDGWPGGNVKLNMPTITNLRRDPFERYRTPTGRSARRTTSCLLRPRVLALCLRATAGRGTRANGDRFPPMQKGRRSISMQSRRRSRPR